MHSEAEILTDHFECWMIASITNVDPQNGVENVLSLLSKGAIWRH